MKLSWLALAVVALGSAVAPAFAQEQEKDEPKHYQGSYFQPPAAPEEHLTPQQLCPLFTQNDDGSWTPKKVVVVWAPDGANSAIVNPEQTFTDGTTFSGIDVAGMLNKACQK